MPRRLQVEFSALVQSHCDAQGTEIDAGDLWCLFRRTYLESASPFKYVGHRLTEHREGQGIELIVEREGSRRTLVGVGNGPIDATVHALDLPLRVNSFEEHSAAPGASARAFAMIETGMAGQPGFRFGVGLHENTVTASIAATISAANRWLGNR
jgi:2-isopropylmalate synthase